MQIVGTTNDYRVRSFDGRRRMKNRCGFTLVEVMAAAWILGISVVCSLLTITKGFEMLDTARNTTMADQILQSELEDIRLLSWEKLPASADITLATELASKFQAKREVTNERTDVKRITISVSWKDYQDRPHSRSYATLYTKNGLADYFVVSRRSSP